MTKRSSFFILGINPYLCIPEMSPCRRRFRNLIPSAGPKRGSVLAPFGLQLRVPHLIFTLFPRIHHWIHVLRHFFSLRTSQPLCPS